MGKFKHFTPPHLKNLAISNCGMTNLSPNFFKIGDKLLSMAKVDIEEKSRDQNFDSSFYCFPAIIMFCTSFEAYLNENLEVSKTLVNIKKCENTDYISKTIENIKNANEIKEKIKLFYKGYDQKGQGVDTNSSIYNNLISLFKLRNEIIHYSPEMTSIDKWPKRLQDVFFRSNPKIKINTDWTTTFGSVTVANWARDTIKSAIQFFAEISGCRDPFSEKTPYPWHWEKEKFDE